MSVAGTELHTGMGNMYGWHDTMCEICLRMLWQRKKKIDKARGAKSWKAFNLGVGCMGIHCIAASLYVYAWNFHNKKSFLDGKSFKKRLSFPHIKCAGDSDHACEYTTLIFPTEESVSHESRSECFKEQIPSEYMYLAIHLLLFMKINIKNPLSLLFSTVYLSYNDFVSYDTF